MSGSSTGIIRNRLSCSGDTASGNWITERAWLSIARMMVKQIKPHGGDEGVKDIFVKVLVQHPEHTSVDGIQFSSCWRLLSRYLRLLTDLLSVLV